MTPDNDYVDMPASDEDTIVIKKTWLIVAGAALGGFILGGLVGFVFATSAFNLGVKSAQAEQPTQAAQPAVAAQQLPSTATPLPSRLDNVSADDDPYIGPADAPIVIVEFSDFRCPYCERFSSETLPLLVEQYGDKLRFVYRDFPAVGGELAALASECADEQDAYWAYHEAIFDDPKGYNTVDDFVSLAEEVEVADIEAFSTCLEAKEMQSEVAKDYTDGRTYGVSGTPTFFINGVRVVGAQPLAAFQSVIDAELERLGQ